MCSVPIYAWISKLSLKLEFPSSFQNYNSFNIVSNLVFQHIKITAKITAFQRDYFRSNWTLRRGLRFYSVRTIFPLFWRTSPRYQPPPLEPGNHQPLMILIRELSPDYTNLNLSVHGHFRILGLYPRIPLAALSLNATMRKGDCFHLWSAFPPKIFPINSLEQHFLVFQVLILFLAVLR